MNLAFDEFIRLSFFFSQHIGVKQVSMSGMSAIAITSNAGVVQYEPMEPARPPPLKQG